MARYLYLKAVMCAIVTILFGFQMSAHAALIENINGAASFPAGLPIRNLTGGGTNGWYYTPGVNYMLDGITTTFQPLAHDQPLLTPTITVQIWTERPINGGILLGQGSFQGNSWNGGTGSATFAPTQLMAGQTYFVNYLNISGMGINFGTWDLDQNSQPAPSHGATISLGSLYTNQNNDGFGHEVTNVFAFASAGSRVGLAEPILNFYGTLSSPSPSPSAAQHWELYK